MEFYKLNDHLTVSGQITPEEIASLADHGFKTLIDNRPDGEVEPTLGSDVMEAAARDAGMGFLYLPVFPGQFTAELIGQMRQALVDLEGPVFAYCRSGTRSTTVWALSQAGQMAAGDIIEQAAGAGYDLRAIAPYLNG